MTEDDLGRGNLLQFRRRRRLDPPSDLQRMLESPRTLLSIEAEEQMVELVDVIARKTGMSIQDVHALAFSRGVETLLEYCLGREVDSHHPNTKDDSEVVLYEAPPRRRPSA